MSFYDWGEMRERAGESQMVCLASHIHPHIAGWKIQNGNVKSNQKILAQAEDFYLTS